MIPTTVAVLITAVEEVIAVLHSMVVFQEAHEVVSPVEVSVVAVVSEAAVAPLVGGSEVAVLAAAAQAHLQPSRPMRQAQTL